MHTDLPLFRWQPPRKLIAFPMINRVGKIRDTAVKMLDKPTDRSAEHYRNQVTTAIVSQFEKIELSTTEIDEQLGAFWEAVHAEMIRMVRLGYGAGGRTA